MNVPQVRLWLLIVFTTLCCVALMLSGCARFDGVVELAADPTSGKAPLSVQFTPLAQGSAQRWIWSFGDGNTSRERSPEHTYTSAGTYTVMLVVVPRDGDPVSVCKQDYITVTAGFRSAPRQLVVQDDEFLVGERGDVQASVNREGNMVFVLDVLANDSPAAGATQLEIVAVKRHPFDPDDVIEGCYIDCSTSAGTFSINRDETAIEYEPSSSAYSSEVHSGRFYYLATDGQTSAVGEVRVGYSLRTSVNARNDSFTILGASDVPRVPDPDCGLAWQLNVLDNDSRGDGPTELTIVGIRAQRSEIWRDKESIDGWVYTEAAQYIRISPDGKAILLANTGEQAASSDVFYYLASNGLTTGEGIVRIYFNDE